MRERPILFSAPMVRAILKGRKNMTRRVYKGSPTTDGEQHPNGSGETWTDWGACPYGKPGDRLWVRETFATLAPGSYEEESPRRSSGQDVRYAANPEDEALARCNGQRWRPCIHMPRWASRILLEITAIRVERLQSITEEDAIAEGIELAHPGTTSTWWKDYEAKPTPDALQDPYHGLAADPVESFASLWRSINGRDSWDANPWVWVVEFRRIAP